MPLALMKSQKFESLYLKIISHISEKQTLLIIQKRGTSENSNNTFVLYFTVKLFI